jgi:hypothetical protein
VTLDERSSLKEVGMRTGALKFDLKTARGVNGCFRYQFWPLAITEYPNEENRHLLYITEQVKM